MSLPATPIMPIDQVDDPEKAVRNLVGSDVSTIIIGPLMGHTRSPGGAYEPAFVVIFNRARLVVTKMFVPFSKSQAEGEDVRDDFINAATNFKDRALTVVICDEEEDAFTLANAQWPSPSSEMALAFYQAQAARRDGRLN